jgi:hypothetical protein
VGHLLGYPSAHLSSRGIAAFEATGIISEWDSAAICAALMLDNLWAAYPQAALLSNAASPILSLHAIPPPDFELFAWSVPRADLKRMSPVEGAKHLLLHAGPSRTLQQRQAIETILNNASQIDNSLTHRVFQELVLGSQAFAATYGLPPRLDTESFLLRYDRPTLSDQARQKLIEFLDDADRHAVIFTSRPSRSPDGRSSTPEAEIGAKGVGLETLPVLGLGGLSWLSAERGVELAALRKPAPAHALAALRRSLGDGLVDALQTTAALVLEGRADPRWEALDEARVYLLEDTVPGVSSLLSAQDILANSGVSMHVQIFGVTDSPPKRQALEAAGAVVVPTLDAALEYVYLSESS